jgi:hypothetical protein
MRKSARTGLGLASDTGDPSSRTDIFAYACIPEMGISASHFPPYHHDHQGKDYFVGDVAAWP